MKESCARTGTQTTPTLAELESTWTEITSLSICSVTLNFQTKYHILLSRDTFRGRWDCGWHVKLGRRHTFAVRNFILFVERVVEGRRRFWTRDRIGTVRSIGDIVGGVTGRGRRDGSVGRKADEVRRHHFRGR